MMIALIVQAPDSELIRVHRDFHLGAGVDTVIAADDESRDEVVTGAEWVIESTTNEFWWPRGGSLKEVLDSIPRRCGSVQSFVRHFVSVAGRQGSFAERMIYRLSPQAPLGDPWRPARRLVRRTGSDGPPLRGWYPIEVLTFAIGGEPPFTHEALERALANGVVQVDTRLRDALRALAQGRAPTFSRPDVVEDAQFAADVAVLGEADVIQTHARLDALEGRLAAVESTLPEMLKRKLRAFVRRP
jgi:hypothetical protein